MQLEKPDFVELLHLLAAAFKSKAGSKHFAVNSTFGRGYFWAESLPSGITVIVSDTCLNQPVVVERLEADEHYFTLQFNEEASDESVVLPKSRRNNEEFQSHVKLSHTLIAENFDFPSSKRLRSVKFFFTKDHLSSLLGKQAVEE